MKKPTFHRETRLGIVIYGGIALAVYINGICQELFNANRGRGIYKLLKAITDSDIVVDIISGTSAGGINGALLAHALANSTEKKVKIGDEEVIENQVLEFGKFAEIWREKGDIAKLLHEYKESKTPLAIESLINGEGYYQNELVNALKSTQPQKAPEEDWFSVSRELDLFVTGTDFLGRHRSILDQTGKVIELKDHHAVFLLKHRQGRKEYFKPENYNVLAKLCRLTSSIPIAFPVVSVKLVKDCDDKLVGRNYDDQLLTIWGKLGDRAVCKIPPENGYQLHFVDGGFLDNKPFGYTIKEIYHRTADRPVDRKLFYVDPDPECLFKTEAFTKMLRPNVLQAARGAFFGIRGYESIAGDLDEIATYNEKVRRYRYLRRDIEEEFNSRAIQDENDEQIGIARRLYLRSRLIDIKDRLLPLLLDMESYANEDLRDDDPVAVKRRESIRRASALLAAYDSEQGQVDKRNKTLRKFETKIRNLDVEYALRKHFQIVEVLCRRMEEVDKDPKATNQDYDRLRTLAHSLSRQIKALEIVREGVNRLFSSKAVGEYFSTLFTDPEINDDNLRHRIYSDLLALHRWILNGNAKDIPNLPGDKKSMAVQASFYRTLGKEANSFYHTLREKITTEHTDWLPQQILTGLLRQFDERIDWLAQVGVAETILKQPEYAHENDEHNNDHVLSVLLCLEQASEELIKESGIADMLEEFNRYRYQDELLYPLEYGTGIREKVIIEATRISADDANLGFGENKTARQKIAGETFFAFGGFFKKAWRSNDILWGRLDGLNRLVEALITERALTEHFPAFLRRTGGHNSKSYIGELVDEAFPLDSAEKEQIKVRLGFLIAPKYYEQLSKMEKSEFIGELQADLVVAGQKAILLEQSFDNLFLDIFEDGQRYKAIESGEDEAANFEAELKKLVDKHRLDQRNLGHQFKEALLTEGSMGSVGSESLQEIPDKLIRSIAERALFLFRDMLSHLENAREEKKTTPRSASILSAATSIEDAVNFLVNNFGDFLSERLAQLIKDRSLDTPVITGFSPLAGGVGAKIIISGKQLRDTSAVRFHETPATFTVNSETQITAEVPSGAQTGKITVISSAGIFKSLSKFKVTLK